jgi:hypothetical protein
MPDIAISTTLMSPKLCAGERGSRATAPIISPNGSVARTPSANTHTTLNHPVNEATRKSSKNNRPGTTTNSTLNAVMSGTRTTWPARYPTSPWGAALARRSVPSSRSVATRNAALSVVLNATSMPTTPGIAAVASDRPAPAMV